MPLAEVARVERRFNEPDGRVLWVEENGVNTAAAAARPHQSLPDPAQENQKHQAPAAGTGKRRATTQAPPPPVSAGDVRCPRCGEQEALSGRRVDADILLSCHTCGYDGPRAANRCCPTCGGDDVVEGPKAVVERSGGTQLSVVRYTTAVLCANCDAGEVAAALAHGGVVLPWELPTVDQQTLLEMAQRDSRRSQAPRDDV